MGELALPGSEWVRSFAVITCPANELCAPIHDRMPVILAPAAWPLWLGEVPAGTDELRALLAPYPAAKMTCWPIGKAVGNIKNNDPSLIKPVSNP